MKKLFLLTVIVLFVFFSFQISRSTRVSKIPNGGKFSCNTCHTNGGGTPRNAFGLAVESITGTSNIEFWSANLAQIDSDGDGWTNGQELQDESGTWTTGSQNPGNSTDVTNPGDSSSHPTTTSVESFEIPAKYYLNNNYPNPFNPTTTIEYEIPVDSDIKIVIFNLLGEEVKTLVDNNLPAGKYLTKWNSKDYFGKKVSSGIYIYSLIADDEIISKKMILAK